jgi:predicted RNA-binding protein with PIN domain
MRARLLLDALLAAAQGLRRELALPPVETLPADLLADPDERPLAPGGGRALDPADPALLDRLLGVPRVHLLVDGYNVTKLEWGSLSLEEQRSRLMRQLAPVAARSGAEVTVVFDGADLRHRPAVSPPRGVRVRFSPGGVTADEVLRDLVRAEPEGRPVVVVSADREVAGFASRAGARAVPSVALVRLLDRAS